MEIWQIALLFVAGVGCGFLNVIAGGGSMLTVPVLLFLGLPGPLANGTNRIAIVTQNVVAMTTFFRHGYPNLRLGITLALASLPGAVLGAMAGTRLDGEWFDRLVAAVMLISLAFMFFEPATAQQRTENPAPISRRRMVLGHVGMMLVGLWGGFIQIGVGLIMMPILHRLLGLNIVETNMHKVFIVMVFTVAAMLVFGSESQILWNYGLVLAVGNGVGGWLGAHFSLRGGERYVRMLFVAVVVIFVVQLIAR